MPAPTSVTVLEELKDKFAEAVMESDEPHGLLTIILSPDSLTEIMTYLKDHEDWQFTFLTDITGVHYPDFKGYEFCVVYHLHSLVHNFRLRLKVFLPEANPSVASLVPLWSSANWMERETYDFFGIIFEGHPNLTKILNIEEQDYFPMRKEYPLEDATRRDKDDAMFGRDRQEDFFAKKLLENPSQN
jgi:NADH-quinone oxidoreductase subunit C